MSLILKKKLSLLDNINYFLIYTIRNRYLKKSSIFFLDNVRTGNIVFVKVLTYEFKSKRTYYFLGLCIGYKRNKLNSSVILRNALSGILIEQHFLLFNNLIILLRNSKKRFVPVGFKKSKLFFLKNLPFFFRLNKAAILDTNFYYNNNKKRFLFFYNKKKLKK